MLHRADDEQGLANEVREVTVQKRQLLQIRKNKHQHQTKKSKCNAFTLKQVTHKVARKTIFSGGDKNANKRSR
ncbi:hypothetical protein BCR24_08615 [Enterococcus ureilyticus]|uniref:Uncharacterized protein n=1 Tax=Enterococcus ureilyticus TaxID=1131292 RepID=A0A1E5H8A0_9ENTE|nr:hypothetical protein BCR24_08615 [Enterococcus ureilyticus]